MSAAADGVRRSVAVLWDRTSAANTLPPSVPDGICVISVSTVPLIAHVVAEPVDFITGWGWPMQYASLLPTVALLRGTWVSVTTHPVAGGSLQLPVVAGSAA